MRRIVTSILLIIAGVCMMELAVWEIIHLPDLDRAPADVQFLIINVWVLFFFGLTWTIVSCIMLWKSIVGE
jgi:sulfite exporter TauE/SafE